MSEPKKELFAKINDQMKTALKAKDQVRLSVLRMVKSKILYVNARGDMADEEIIKIINKYGKDLKESITEFEKVGKGQEAAEHEKELAIVKEFLPQELSPEEIKNLVSQTIQEVGASSIKEMGNVMKAVLAKQPSIDGKVVSQLVREILK
ncbi:hypothetical protein A2291_02460 [candidate division WOR-1 bacterium RIFOXYB2_FULL_42_35]|uniref:Glutamyl-tRNA amidotransferase n=1 Tax=candidate division WOR-1 bacterium RIFOXYC2_FULL_41_25 TaxID=1802586 RepID=A0A1F4TP87_UNCSA|nr:MAG: hypothetical protein A2247_05365 [candidate division WOR-1 bacterium RIFOXYA2_FULL_41_14]OGC25086.1 MAG: hypothetical protein A2291_02460 [candidate division WOR-1 bacterium RIFOXYB2_FULL_42_35]OGC34486.1 MAG: hypothetical protein A2462_04280 [candidate division WOR-1 bacterium RIFOXYC2_FULL_41_25]OGC43874.1 MAG: hypothetical protein A2548_08090 [candidate division WOR-1 bacterium RIFOXYD2_FULL_41_8]